MPQTVSQAMLRAKTNVTFLVFALLVVSTGGQVGTAYAQEEPAVDAAYLWDGGALPFVYGSAALAIGLRLFATPASTPRLFLPSEGGRDGFRNSVPEWTLAAYAVGLAGGIALVPNPGRWHHLKGYGETLLTTIALTEIAKNVFGRHRPHYQPGMPDNLDQRRSFFSGHASVTGASSVYLALYLSRNVLPHPSLLKTGSLLLLGAVLVGVPYSRVVDGRHHLSDVVTGAAVGGTVAALFYAYQESRLNDWQEGEAGKRRHRLQLVPNLRNPGLSLVSQF